MRLGRAFAAITHACLGPSALTWTAWLITLPLSVAVALTPESLDSTRSIGAGALAAVIAHVVLIPAFVISRWWLRRPRALIGVLLIYASLGALRGLAVVIIEQSIAPSDGTSLIGRVAVSAALAVFGFAIIAVVVDRIRTYREAIQRLREAVRQVHDVGPIPGQLAAIEATLDGLGREAGIRGDELADRLQHLIEDDVRPISHTLMAEPHHTHEPPGTEPQAPRIRLRIPPPNPWLVAVTLEGGALVAVIRQVGPWVALVNLIVAGIAVVVVGYAVNAAIRRLAGGSRAAAVILIAVGYAVVGVFAMLTSDLVFRIFGYAVPLFLIAIPFAAIWAILVSLATGADSQARSTEDALTGLLRQEVIAATVSRVATQALARRIHGGLQGDLAAIMMAVRRADSPDVVKQAQQQLLTISQSLVDALAPHDSTSTQDIGDEVDSFMGVWSQALDVQWQMGPDCLRRLREDPQAWSGVRAVIMEGLTNVIRHASEPTAVVTVSLQDRGFLVDIASTGTLTIANPGLGLRTLRESFAAVDLRQRNDDVLLSVHVIPHGTSSSSSPPGT